MSNFDICYGPERSEQSIKITINWNRIVKYLQVFFMRCYYQLAVLFSSTPMQFPEIPRSNPGVSCHSHLLSPSLSPRHSDTRYTPPVSLIGGLYLYVYVLFVFVCK